MSFEFGYLFKCYVADTTWWCTHLSLLAVASTGTFVDDNHEIDDKTNIHSYPRIQVRVLIRSLFQDSTAVEHYWFSLDGHHVDIVFKESIRAWNYELQPQTLSLFPALTRLFKIFLFTLNGVSSSYFILTVYIIIHQVSDDLFESREVKSNKIRIGNPDPPKADFQ